MSDNTFTLDVDQASELKHAFKRNGGTNTDIKMLTAGEALKDHLRVLDGARQIRLPQFPNWGGVTITINDQVAGKRYAEQMRNHLSGQMKGMENVSQDHHDRWLLLKSPYIKDRHALLELGRATVTDLGFVCGVDAKSVLERLQEMKVLFLPSDIKLERELPANVHNTPEGDVWLCLQETPDSSPYLRHRTRWGPGISGQEAIDCDEYIIFINRVVVIT